MSFDEDQVLLFGSDPHPSLSDVYRKDSDTYLRLNLPRLSQEYDGDGEIVAVVDTGLLSHHPDIRTRLVQAVDFTGEGPEDEVGHGTKVALLLAAYDPGVQFVSVKVLGTGVNSADWLIRGIDWVGGSSLVRLANISAGVYRPRCRGDCSVCQAARRATQAGAILEVAAGNQPGITACPAKATDSVVAVAAIDPVTQALAEHSSRSGICGFAAYEPRPAVEWVSKDA
jgi:subtilisin family serine protease